MRQRLGAGLAFDTRRSIVIVSALVCLACGLRSLALGQDTAWDLLNYHLYAPWAWWQGRLELDLAPAQLQSYFAPFGDLPMWLLLQLDAPRLAGFLMGALHGLAFALVALVALQVLPAQRHRAALAAALGLAGLFSVTFLSELGGSMGNNTSALPLLASVLLVLEGQREQGRRSVLLHAAAGVCLGVGEAMKLTNAPFALALAAAILLFGSGSFGVRLRKVSLLSAAAVLIFAVLAGPWFLAVWHGFGNPVMPQANGWFHAPLADTTPFGDLRWMPTGWLERLTWPIVFTLHPQRVGEEGLRQLLWLALPAVGLAVIVRALSRRTRSARAAPLAADRPVALLAGFFVFAFVLWMQLFSIHRYLVVLELLGPILVWLGLRWCWPTTAGRRVAIATLLACSLAGWAGQGEWGHEDWAEHAFAIEAPPLADAARTTALLVGPEPQAWRATLLPPELAWIGVATSWPETAAYRERVRQIATQRGGPVFAMLPAAADRSVDRLARYNASAARFGLDAGPDCTLVRWLARRKLRAEVEVVDGRCRFAARAADVIDLPVLDAVERAASGERLAARGLQFDAAGCRRYAAWAGKREVPYQWCPVR
ncbi:hypothetical protein BH09PSE6_BH09PSE6_32090 [soil metagenome]